jgi:hypothetical protein
VSCARAAPVQVALVKKMDGLAQHELDTARLLKLLIAVASRCQYQAEPVLVKPSSRHLPKLEGLGLLEGGVPPPHVILDSSPSAGLGPDLDLLWLAKRGASTEPFSTFQVDSGLPGAESALLKFADLRLRGLSMPCFIVMPRGKRAAVEAQLQSPWAQTLIESVRQLGTVRLITEESLDYVLSDPKLAADVSIGALDLLCTVTESLVAELP